MRNLMTVNLATVLLKDRIFKEQLKECLKSKTPEERAAIMKVIESPEFKQRL